jgi:hypothetical protein
MLSRNHFLRELIQGTVGAAARFLDDSEGAPDPADRRAEQAFAFTELSPALLAMEAERMGGAATTRCPELLRRQLYRQMKQQAPVSGPDTETNV